MKFEKLSENKFQSLTKDEMNQLFGGIADTNAPGDTCAGWLESGKTVTTPDPKKPAVTITHSNDWKKDNVQRTASGTKDNDMSCDLLQGNNSIAASFDSSMLASASLMLEPASMSSMLAQANAMPQSVLGLLM